MKKIAVLLGLLILSQSLAFADEILDAQGNTTKCKVMGITNGLIEYKKDGMPRTFTREMNSSVFNDYVDVQTNLVHKDSVVRYSGNILIKDMQEVVLQTNEGNMRIPWYKVRLIGVFKP